MNLKSPPSSRSIAAGKRCQPGRRRTDGVLHDAHSDPYRPKGKPRGTTVCSRCGAILSRGRWCWPRPGSAAPAGHAICQACRRIQEDAPAGILTITGGFASDRLNEILELVRHQARLESARHPLNRIMAMKQQPGTVVITTTDIHLPGRIGRALRRAHKGTLQIDYEQAGCFARAQWTA